MDNKKKQKLQDLAAVLGLCTALGAYFMALRIESDKHKKKIAKLKADAQHLREAREYLHDKNVDLDKRIDNAKFWLIVTSEDR